MSIEPAWFGSSYSGSGGDNCVEAVLHTEAVHVRDSKGTGRPPLTLSTTAWSDFTAYASAHGV